MSAPPQGVEDRLSGSLGSISVVLPRLPRGDPEGACGLSHLLEHCLVAEVAHRSPDSPRRISARTEDDVLVLTSRFSVDNPRDWEVAAGELAAIGELRSLGEYFARERNAVVHELTGRYADSPLARWRQDLYAVIFPAGHPYQRPRGGVADEVRAITSDQVADELFGVRAGVTVGVAGRGAPAGLASFVADTVRGPGPAVPRHLASAEPPSVQIWESNGSLGRTVVPYTVGKTTAHEGSSTAACWFESFFDPGCGEVRQVVGASGAAHGWAGISEQRFLAGYTVLAAPVSSVDTVQVGQLRSAVVAGWYNWARSPQPPPGLRAAARRRAVRSRLARTDPGTVAEQAAWLQAAARLQPQEAGGTSQTAPELGMVVL